MIMPIAILGLAALSCLCIENARRQPGCARAGGGGARRRSPVDAAASQAQRPEGLARNRGGEPNRYSRTVPDGDAGRWPHPPARPVEAVEPAARPPDKGTLSFPDDLGSGQLSELRKIIHSDGHGGPARTRQPVIAVDAMGGDHAPAAIVAGAVDAYRQWGLSVVLSAGRARSGRCSPSTA